MTARRFTNAALLGLGLGLLLPLCVGCTTPDDEPDGPTGRDIVESVVTHSVTPDIVALREAAEGMKASVDGFCSAPDTTRLFELQGGWRTLAERWSAASLYNLGPLDDDVITPRILFFESMRQRGTDYTNTVRETYEQALADGEALDPAFFESLYFHEQGVLALEVLVFEDSREGHSTAPDDIVADFSSEPRKCAYLEGVMTLLLDNARLVERGWTESFGDAGQPFAETMLEERLPDGAQPIEALLIAIVEHLQYVKDRKLEGILDAQLAGHFYANQEAMLLALETLVVQPATDDRVSILDVMAARGVQADADTVLTNLEMAQQAAAAQDREALAVAIGLLEGNFKREVPDGLGVMLGVTFSDGD